jgi:Serine/Threonine/Tyrosine Kinase found in polyvalent proteins
MKYELQNIISGKSKVEYGDIIQTIASYLKRSQTTSQVAQEFKQFRQQENETLALFIESNNLLIADINIENYVTEGAEQKVYLKDGKSVIKLNDAIFYHSWIDYFNNLLLHNYFFTDTAYKLLGFHKYANGIFAVVEQPYVKATEHTNLETVKKFMLENGFENKKNHDYFNSKLGIILEDLHDENVLTKNGNLYFIDTVFYLLDSFYDE